MVIWPISSSSNNNEIVNATIETKSIQQRETMLYNVIHNLCLNMSSFFLVVQAFTETKNNRYIMIDNDIMGIIEAKLKE